MRRYAGKTFVIKYGGHAMGDEKVATPSRATSCC
jgi:acetylglutamate kinase